MIKYNKEVLNKSKDKVLHPYMLKYKPLDNSVKIFINESLIDSSDYVITNSKVIMNNIFGFRDKLVAVYAHEIA